MVRSSIYRHIVVLCSFIALAGCSGNLLSYRGKTVTQPYNVLDLKDGDQQGVWKTNDLSISYRYRFVNGTLKISGEVALPGGLVTGFNAVDRLVVELLLLNNDHTVIDNVNIYVADRFHSTRYIPMEFDAAVPVPPGVESVSFTYDGRLSDSAGVDEGTSFDFWYFPN